MIFLLQKDHATRKYGAYLPSDRLRSWLKPKLPCLAARFSCT